MFWGLKKVKSIIDLIGDTFEKKKCCILVKFSVSEKQKPKYCFHKINEKKKKLEFPQ